MSINKRIIEKVKDKTENDINSRLFLLAILDKESEGLSWYKPEYKVLIEKNREGWKKNENNRD